MQLTCGNHYENIFVKINDFNIGLRPSNFDFNAILNGFIHGISNTFEFSSMAGPGLLTPSSVNGSVEIPAFHGSRE